MAAVVTVAAMWAARVVPAVSPMVISLLIGAVAGSVLAVIGASRPHVVRWQRVVHPGTQWAAKHLLRAGVVLLGFQIAFREVLSLGWHGLGVVALTMIVTFGGTLLLGRWLRLPSEISLLIATGYSVCGAAAISAMTAAVGGTSEKDDEAVGTGLAMVTLFGSVAIFVLPWLAGLLNLSDHDAGLWIGASVQEVAQVVMAAGSVSTAALATATVAKLTRVALLAPLVAVAGVVMRRRAAAASAVTDTAIDAPAGDKPRRRTSPVPLFVVGFCVAVAIRSVDVLPAEWIAMLTRSSQILFVAAMFAMGLGINLPHLVRSGRRSLVLGAVAALLVTAVALAGTLA